MLGTVIQQSLQSRPATTKKLVPLDDRKKAMCVTATSRFTYNDAVIATPGDVADLHLS